MMERIISDRQLLGDLTWGRIKGKGKRGGLVRAASIPTINGNDFDLSLS